MTLRLWLAYPGSAEVAQRVLVTGGLGRLGRVVCDDLLAHGYEVVALDQERLGSTEPERFRCVLGDVTDVGTVAQVIAGCDALIHLAAIPAPGAHPDDVVFGGNAAATFAALQAAALTGVARVVIASSGSAYGWAFSPQLTQPDYLPVDEIHPLRPADPYGLSKQVSEQIAATFCRRMPLSVVALRFHWIVSREEQLTAIAERRGRPDVDRERRNLWGYVDVRDAARACRLAIEVAVERSYGFHALNVAAADTLAEEPVEKLLAAHLPDVPVRGSLTGPAGLFAIDRAKEVLGWEPQHSWRRID